MKFLYIFYSKDGSQNPNHKQRKYPLKPQNWGLPTWSGTQKPSTAHPVCCGTKPDGRACNAIWKQNTAEYLAQCTHFWTCWRGVVDELLLRFLYYFLCYFLSDYLYIFYMIFYVVLYVIIYIFFI